MVGSALKLSDPILEPNYVRSYYDYRDPNLTITSSATSGLPSDPVGMKAHDRPVIHCALIKKEFMKENESNLLRNPVCKGIPPNPQSRHCPERSDQYFWAGSLVLGKHHLLKTNMH